MKVAFGTVNITPNDFCGKALAGYTRKEPCLGKLDDLYAHTILLSNGSANGENSFFLLISIDLLKIPLSICSYIKTRILQFYPQIKDDESIVIHGTHTHAGFDLTGEFYWPGGILNVMRGIMFGANRNDKYIIWFTNKIVRMLQTLFNGLIECTFAWKKEKFNPGIVINRRHPSRESKPYLGVVVFKEKSKNQIIGMLITYACHPTTLSYQNNKLSADYPGKVISKITDLSKGKVKAIYFNGPSGDLNPITTCGIEYNQLEGDKKMVYDQLGDYQDTERIGVLIAERAFKMASRISDSEFHEGFEVATISREFSVPMEDYKYFSKRWFSNKLNFIVKKYFLMRVAYGFIKGANFPIFKLKGTRNHMKCKTLVEFIRISANSPMNRKDLGLITVPGELFEQLGDELLNLAPTPREDTFIFQNSQDWIAYLFPLKEYTELGGYEPIPSFSPLAGRIIESQLKKMFNDIKER
jgi:hypothetical protein